MDRVLPDRDTTFALQRSAQRRGHVALHAELRRHRRWQDARVWAHVRNVTVSDSSPNSHFGASEDIDLSAADCVLVRKDPPFDSHYLYVTLMLETPSRA